MGPVRGRYGQVREAVPILYCIVIVCERVHAVWITYFGVEIYILVQQYIFQSRNAYFRTTIHISEHHYIFQSTITYFRGGGMHTVRTRSGHGENDKLELYEDREFGTRPGRTRYRLGIDRYGPGDK